MTVQLHPDQIAPQLLAGLDPAQREAVLTLNGPLLVVAGPGSGKTRVLTTRLAALTQAGVWPSNLLAVTFTNKAAGEMRERLAALIGEDEARRAQVSTFHSLCARILRQHHDHLGLPARFTILDSDDATRVLARVAQNAGLLADKERSEATEFVKQAYSTISRAKNAGVSPADMGASPNPQVRQTAELMAEYNNQLKQLGAVDFDDLLLHVWWLLREVPAVASWLQSRWTHVSVDEFQDTNAVQYQIVSALTARHRNLCVVGDADQSIYAFRGARPAVVDEFTRDHPDAHVVVLNHNYRSTAGICEVSKAVIAANHSPFRSEQQTTQDTGAPVKVIEFPSDLDEARTIVNAIVEHGGRLGDHAILVRTNALTRSLEQVLTRASVDYEVVGATRFYDRAEVKDAMAWLRVAFNDRDQMAFARAASAPKRGLGSVTISKLADEADASELPILAVAEKEAAEARTKAQQTLGHFVSLIDLVAERAGSEGPSAAMQTVLEECGVRAHVRLKDAKERTSREENLDQLLAHAREYDGQGSSPAEAMEAYLEAVSLLESTDDPNTADEARDRVQILTIHAAKGKEFPHVYVVGVEEDVLPHFRAEKEGPAALEEERRLMFVATSRAQKTLTLTWCNQRMRFGTVQTAKPSRFLDDLPDHLVEHVAHHGTERRGAGRPGWLPAGRDTRHFLPDGRRGPGIRAATVPAARKAPVREAKKASIVAEVAPGDRVEHKMFGTGTVRGVDRVADSLEVAFDTVGVKVLNGTLAPLTRI